MEKFGVFDQTPLIHSNISLRLKDLENMRNDELKKASTVIIKPHSLVRDPPAPHDVIQKRLKEIAPSRPQLQHHKSFHDVGRGRVPPMHAHIISKLNELKNKTNVQPEGIKAALSRIEKKLTKSSSGQDESIQAKEEDESEFMTEEEAVNLFLSGVSNSTQKFTPTEIGNMIDNEFFDQVPERKHSSTVHVTAMPVTETTQKQKTENLPLTELEDKVNSGPFHISDDSENISSDDDINTPHHSKQKTTEKQKHYDFESPINDCSKQEKLENRTRTNSRRQLKSNITPTIENFGEETELIWEQQLKQQNKQRIDHFSELARREKESQSKKFEEFSEYIQQYQPQLSKKPVNNNTEEESDSDCSSTNSQKSQHRTDSVSNQVLNDNIGLATLKLWKEQKNIQQNKLDMKNLQIQKKEERKLHRAKVNKTNELPKALSGPNMPSIAQNINNQPSNLKTKSYIKQRMQELQERAMSSGYSPHLNPIRSSVSKPNFTDTDVYSSYRKQIDLPNISSFQSQLMKLQNENEQLRKRNDLLENQVRNFSIHSKFDESLKKNPRKIIKTPRKIMKTRYPPPPPPIDYSSQSLSINQKHGQNVTDISSHSEPHISSVISAPIINQNLERKMAKLTEKFKNELSIDWDNQIKSMALP